MATKTSGRTTAKQAKELGSITGVNHLVLVCKNMEETLDFYNGILGLKIRRRLDDRPSVTGLGVRGRFCWFELRNGDVVALLEDADRDTTPETSFAAKLWPIAKPPPEVPRKMDHLALNVDTLEDLRALQDKLRKADWPVSEIDHRPDLVHSIYFYDPNGMPLEAACWAQPNDGAPASTERTLT